MWTMWTMLTTELFYSFDAKFYKLKARTNTKLPHQAIAYQSYQVLQCLGLELSMRCPKYFVHHSYESPIDFQIETVFPSLPALDPYPDHHKSHKTSQEQSCSTPFARSISSLQLQRH